MQKGFTLKKIKINNIADIRTGYQVRSRLTPINEGTHYVIQMRNICQETGLILEDVDFCRVNPNPMHIERYLLKEGDVLFLTRGNNHPATFITEEYTDFVAAGQFMVITMKSDECLPEYLCWYLNSPEAEYYFAREARGTAVKIIAKSTVRNLPVPLPDTESQKNIVKLGKLSLKEEALMHALKEKRKQLIYAQCKSKLT